jgi:hypothetical protein
MKPGLITLADLPDLAGGKKPTSTIVVARLDDKLRDPRYGSFKITQSDVNGWQRNLTDTFGGRVAIDADHSSDRGGGTRAMGWITGIGQDGKLVTADVEWTPRGAKAIRNGDYRHISPTFVADYGDEHGEKHGRALIGAALTNRPVLRRGMPCLSLSRDSFDGVAVPRKRRKNGRTMKKLSKSELQTLSRSTDRSEISRLVSRLSAKQARKVIAASRTAARARGDGTPKLMASAMTDLAISLSAEQAAGIPSTGKRLRKLALDAGADPEAVRIMMEPDADPELQRMFFAQLVPDAVTLDLEFPRSDAPITMDAGRYGLHRNAKNLAEAKCAADPTLDPYEAYCLAAEQLLEAGDPRPVI